LLARLAWWSGRGDEALVIRRQAVAAHPGSSLVRAALGEAYQSIAGRPDLGVSELRKAVALDPGRPAAHVDLALTLLRIGRPKQAEDAARRCLERAPDLSPALSVLGAALADQGSFEAAASAYASALLLARRGASVGTDALGRVSAQSRTVTTGELPGGLGYIRLSNFTDPNLVAEVRAALESMRRKEGIVLDLRGNGGGLARAADEIGDLLVGPGKQAGTDASGAGEAPQVTGGDGAVTDSPLTVLVDGQTGSAAERLARALTNTGRASLAGDPTLGKGRAQVSRVLPGGTT